MTFCLHQNPLALVCLLEKVDHLCGSGCFCHHFFSYCRRIWSTFNISTPHQNYYDIFFIHFCPSCNPKYFSHVILLTMIISPYPAFFGLRQSILGFFACSESYVHPSLPQPSPFWEPYSSSNARDLTALLCPPRASLL